MRATEPAPKSARALKGGKGVNSAGASSTTPVPALQGEATDQTEIIETPEKYESDCNIVSSNGVTMSEQALNNGSAAQNRLGQDSAAAGEKGMSSNGPTKRKASSTPNVSPHNFPEHFSSKHALILLDYTDRCSSIQEKGLSQGSCSTTNPKGT